MAVLMQMVSRTLGKNHQGFNFKSKITASFTTSSFTLLSLKADHN